MTSPAGLDPVVVRCDGALTLAAAAEHRERLLRALDDNHAVVVDVRGAEDVDMTFIQLLVAAQKSAAYHGKTVHVGAPEGSLSLAKLMSAAVSSKDFPQRMDVPAGLVIAGAPEAEVALHDGDIDPAAITTLIAEIGAPAVSQSLHVFFSEMFGRLTTLRSLSPKTDASAVLREAHLLKGTAGTFGLRKLSGDIAEFERTAAGMSVAVYKAAVERMTQHLELAQSALEASAAQAA